MSASEPELPDDVLSGAFYRLGVVDSEIDEQTLDDIKDGTEEPTYVGNTHDGFESDIDWQEFDVNPSTGAVTQQYSTHVAYTLSCNTFATPGTEQLENAGLVDDSSGQILSKNKVEGVVVEVFDEDPRNADDWVETIVFANVEIRLDGLEYGEDDAGELPLEMTVNDHPYLMSHRDDPA